jgi:MoxR-like ATPase
MALPLEPAKTQADLANLVHALEANVARVVRGKAKAIRQAAVTLIARGHLLIEDVPGVGKTTLARSLAGSIGGVFHRIQFTSDLLPSDIVGVSVLDAKAGRFEFHRGAIFANLVLADEINRTTPRTQSALLEAMSDGQVSVDGKSYVLDPPFMVIATQNPEEHYGTYPLPESQLDRFLMRIRMDYPSAEDEKRLLLEVPGRLSDGAAALSPVLQLNDVRALQEASDQVHLEPDVAAYIVAVARESRRSPYLSLGVSPRGQLLWRNAARALALTEGRSYVLPDDLKALAIPVLAHRVVVSAQSDHLARSHQEAERILLDLIDRIPAPG